MELFTVKADAAAEFVEKKSVFTGRVFYVPDIPEAEKRIAALKKEFSGATHNVWAYRLQGGAQQRYSDDGEPQGTAGVPVLSVLENSGLTNVLCVVTRYFGGVLLGAGGLVRAYSRAASLSLEAAGRARLVQMAEFSAECPYSQSKTLLHYLEKYGAENISAGYTDKVLVTAFIEDRRYGELEHALTSALYHGLVLRKKNAGLSRKT